MMSDLRRYYVEDPNGELKEIIEVWESFSGWYWFITEKETEPYEGVIGIDEKTGKEITQWGIAAFGKVYGLETEWGSIWMPDLENNKRIWKVAKSNWHSISHVTTIHPNQEEVKETE